MRWSYRLIRIAGTDVKLHITFLIYLAWIAYGAYQQGGREVAIATVVLVLGVFLCVVLHEFGHIAMARRFGVRTPDVILLPIGGLARLERMPEEPKQELLIALAGPAVTLLIAAGLFGGLALAGQQIDLANLDPARSPPLQLLAVINVWLLLFNLIPAFPMDGGRVLRALLAMKMGLQRATRTAASVGQMLAIAAGIFAIFNGAFILALIAFFIFLGAGAEAAAVESRFAGQGLRVLDMMMTRFQVIPVHARLEHAVQLLLAGDQREFPVVDNLGHLEGILSREGLIRGLSQGGSQATVGEAMNAGVPVLRPDQGFEEAVSTLRASGLPALPVVDGGGTLIGLLSNDNISELLMVRKATGRQGEGTKD